MVIKWGRIEELLKRTQYKNFCKFMEGQTVDANGVYEDDFLRFVKKQPVID